MSWVAALRRWWLRERCRWHQHLAVVAVMAVASGWLAVWSIGIGWRLALAFILGAAVAEAEKRWFK